MFLITLASGERHPYKNLLLVSAPQRQASMTQIDGIGPHREITCFLRREDALNVRSCCRGFNDTWPELRPLLKGMMQALLKGVNHALKRILR